jgi:hypothetical protein
MGISRTAGEDKDVELNTAQPRRLGCGLPISCGDSTAKADDSGCGHALFATAVVGCVNAHVCIQLPTFLIVYSFRTTVFTPCSISFSISYTILTRTKHSLQECALADSV